MVLNVINVLVESEEASNEVQSRLFDLGYTENRNSRSEILHNGFFANFFKSENVFVTGCPNGNLVLWASKKQDVPCGTNVFNFSDFLNYAVLELNNREDATINFVVDEKSDTYESWYIYNEFFYQYKDNKWVLQNHYLSNFEKNKLIHAVRANLLNGEQRVPLANMQLSPQKEKPQQEIDCQEFLYQTADGDWLEADAFLKSCTKKHKNELVYLSAGYYSKEQILGNFAMTEKDEVSPNLKHRDGLAVVLPYLKPKI